MMFQIQAKINETNIGYLGCGKKIILSAKTLRKESGPQKMANSF